MLIIMRGATCSGKSTFIETNFQNPNAVLSSDDYREILFGDRAFQRKNDELFGFIQTILKYRLASKVNWTVLDATHIKMRDVRNTIELCKEYGSLFTILSIQPPSLDELHRRNENREGMTIPSNIVEKHYNGYFNNLDNFKTEISNNLLGSWIEIDQNDEVIDAID